MINDGNFATDFKGISMKKIYTNINKLSFWICLSSSLCLLIASWFVPPRAVIDSSVLTAVGEVFGFATLGTVIEAIGRGADLTFQRGDTSVTVDNPSNAEEA